MNQALYAHMNNKTIKKRKKNNYICLKKRTSDFGTTVNTILQMHLLHISKLKVVQPSPRKGKLQGVEAQKNLTSVT
jgi:hypothetical protein